MTGTEGDDTPRFRYADPATAGVPGYTEVFDANGVSDPLPASCGRPADAGGQPDSDFALCEDGGTAHLLTVLELNLGGGADQPTLEACFNAIEVDAGEGANRVVAPDCGGGTLSVAAGAGQDSVWGPNKSDPSLGIGIVADLGAGDDSSNMRGGGGPTLIHGGAGHDDLLAGSGNDQLFGDDGDDFFMGRAGNDTYDGGPGDDRIGIPKSSTSTDDDQGNDDYRGGPGSDLLELAAHASGMTIAIDDAANDGSAGETDNVHNDIEVIRGTGKNDVFTGSAGPDRFEGNGDSDTIHGGGGDDLLFGGGGDDQVFGDTGNDKIEGTNGADTLDGGPGTDQIYGDIGNCSAFCNFDADVLLARDGERDVVDCGGGADSAQVDQLDVVAFCSTIDRQTTGPAGSPSPVSGAPPKGASAVFTLMVAPRPRISKGVRVTLTCPAACSYAMSVVLSSKTARKLKLGRKALSVGTVRGGMLAGSKKLTVRLSPKSKRKLGRARRVEARLKAVVKDSAGKSSTQTKSITLGR